MHENFWIATSENQNHERFNPLLLMQSLGFNQWAKNSDNIGAIPKAANDIIPEMNDFIDSPNSGCIPDIGLSAQ